MAPQAAATALSEPHRVKGLGNNPAGLWTAASKLRAGDQIRSAGNGRLTVVDVSPASAVAFDATPVYSLEVDDLESFAVGNLEAWGHNGRPSSSTLRRRWSEYSGLPWPKTPDGKNYDVCHIVAEADGGDHSPGNLKPMTREQHIEEHKKRGDFARWARRRSK